MNTRFRRRPGEKGASGRRALAERVAGRAGSFGMTLLAALGVVCIVCVSASLLFKVNFVVFRTGSMEPAYPVGALAAVREVPASSLKPGDVATVQRTANSVPITHRVVTAHPAPASVGGAVLVMKGDANTSVDPVEYRVQSARLMVFSVPVLGAWIMELRSPWVIAGSTVFLAGLVGWVFWPRRQPAKSNVDTLETQPLSDTKAALEVPGGDVTAGR
jgi:signal peptidase